MSRKKKPLPLLQEVEIQDVAAEGKALVRIDGLVVFVPYAVPGDIVDIQLTRKKHSYAEGTVVHLHRPSPLRATPFCRHFGVCGGCKWQCLAYEEQLRYKQKQVYDTLVRIGKVNAQEWLPIKGNSAGIKSYRNKLEFGFSNKKWLTREQINSGEAIDNMNALGFHITGAFDKILDIEECFLMNDINNQIRNGIRSYALEHQLTFFDLRKQEGLLRNIMIRTAPQEVMLLIQFCIKTEEDEAAATALLEWAKTEFPQITSLLYVNNTKCNDTIGDLEVKTFAGTDYIVETMEDLRFKVGPKSFYQTNTEQAYELYKVVREFANLSGKELVYDLYTGTGTIAQFVAKKAREVVGIEYVPEAIEDAKVNAQANNLTNTKFFSGDMKDLLTDDFVCQYGKPDVIITDPPRAGMHPDVVRTILRVAPHRIVYVSCNPATQARDLEMMSEKYDVMKVQPVDMFPHTHHVENVALLLLKQSDDKISSNEE